MSMRAVIAAVVPRMTTKVRNLITSSLTLVNGPAPATPGTGKTTIFADTSGVPRYVNDAGVDSELATTGALAASTGASLVGFQQSGTGAVARTLASKLTDEVNLLDFIPTEEHASLRAGTSMYDCAAAMQKAAVESGGVFTLPKGVFHIESPVNLFGVSIKGAGQFETIIKANAAISHMLQVGNRQVVEDVQILGNGLATHCLQFLAANGISVTRCRIEGARRNGIYVPMGSNNNSGTIDTCLIRNNGYSYSTGTASGSAGGTTLAFSGAADLTTLGISAAHDYIWVDGVALDYPFEITGVTENTLTIYPALPTAVAGATYRVVGGAGIMIDRHGDNNVLTIMRNSIQSNKACGIQDYGLFGSKSAFNTYDGNGGCARIIGRRQGPNQYVVNGSLEMGNYHESSVTDSLFYANAVRSNVIVGTLGQLPKIVRNHGSQVLPASLDSLPSGALAATELRFPAAQVPSADVNTLDDYEEGTFTPTIIGATTAGEGTYSVQSGRYTKIGDLVHCDIHIVWTAHTGSGGMSIGGLPFASNPATAYRAAASIGYVRALTLSAGDYLTGQLGANATAITLWTANISGANPVNTPMDTSAYLAVSVTYKV